MLYRLQEHFGQTADELAFQVSRSRYQRPENLQRSAKISRIQHQGATDSTCHGTDKILAAAGLLQGGFRHVLSDTRCMHGITVGTPVLCAMVAAEFACPHPRCGAASQFQVRGHQVLLLAQIRTSDGLGNTTVAA